ncbi:MAG: hypothetical protein LZF61_00255 [Nitrosomonas sp.]|nr:MAG: hypothetical protein LZF61_00255 [Nitrosomonas sp.]
MKRLRFLLVGEFLQKKHQLTATVHISIEFRFKKTGENVTKQLGIFESDVNGYVSFELFKFLPEAKDIELRHLWLTIEGDHEVRRDVLDQYLTSQETNLLLIHVPHSVWRTECAI